MNIFLTWSGKKSLAIATALHDWIPSVLQRVKPFLSSEDIRKGSRWQAEIAQQLADVQFAIVCLTPDNLSAPWIHFEAGAISKHVQSGRVTALLADVPPEAIVGPLVQFQHTTPTKDDIRKLMSDLNELLGDGALPDNRFGETFEVFWPLLDKKLTAAREAGATAAPPQRSTHEVLAEVLEMNRENGRTLASLVQIQAQVGALLLDRMTRLESAQEYKPLGMFRPRTIAGTYVGEGLLGGGSGHIPPTLQQREKELRLADALRRVAPASTTPDAPLSEASRE